MGARPRVIRAVAALLAVVAAGCSDGAMQDRPSAAPATTTTPPVASPSSTGEPGSLAYVTATAVRLLPPSGTPRTLVSLRANEDVHRLAATRDGRYLAWAHTVGPHSGVTVHEVGTGRSARWWPGKEVAVDTLHGTESGFVLTHAGEPRLGVLDAAAVLATGGGEPRWVTLGVPQPRLLLAAGDRVLVASAEGAAPSGGPETVYAVTLDGRATRLFTDGEGQPEGEVRNRPVGGRALTADGRRFVYATGATGGGDACEAPLAIVVRDLEADREVPVPGPEVAGSAFAPEMTTGGDGRVVAVVSNLLADCDTGRGFSAAYALDGDAWTKVSDDAAWAATDDAGRLAVVTRSRALVLDGRQVDAGEVEYAVWAGE